MMSQAFKRSSKFKKQFEELKPFLTPKPYSPNHCTLLDIHKNVFVTIYYLKGTGSI